MKTILRVLDDGHQLWVASIAMGKAEQLGPFATLEEAMHCLDKKEKKKCKSELKTCTKKTDVGSEKSKPANK